MSSPELAMLSHWCYNCNRSVNINDSTVVSCPDCDGGFVEEIENLPENNSHRPTRQRSGSLPPFNPVVVFRGGEENNNSSALEFYYNDGSGTGLIPLPPSESEIFTGSGFDRMLFQLTQVDFTGFGRPQNPPASKAAIGSLPTIEIGESHVAGESHCAVCIETFDLGVEAREMPCKHMFHGDCITPWLSIRNSCPVCRHELPADTNPTDSGGGGADETVGLTIWRLPGGSFAVGRFNAGRREAERALPAILYPETGRRSSGSAVGGPRVWWWTVRRERGGGGGIRRAVRGLISHVRMIGLGNSDSRSISSNSGNSLSHPVSSDSGSETGRVATGLFRRSNSSSIFGRMFRRGRNTRGGPLME